MAQPLEGLGGDGDADTGAAERELIPGVIPGLSAPLWLFSSRNPGLWPLFSLRSAGREAKNMLFVN